MKIFTKRGWQNRTFQKYLCSVCGHIWHNADLFGMFNRPVITQAIFMYLRGISLNTTASIFRSWFNTNVFSKVSLLKHIEEYSDQIPDHSQITEWLKPARSGYYAIDGTWLKYRGKGIVLLILLDVKTLDIVSWRVAREESRESYNKLLVDAYSEINSNIKGFFCDGDPGLLEAIKDLFPYTPIQLCVFHKYTRAGQIISFKHIKNDVDKEIKKKVEAVLFANSKESALSNMAELKRYAREHQNYKKLQKLIGALKRNFDLLLTHFDHQDMSPYNNVLEGFNHIIKRKTKLMKGFKKPVNINKWIKLIITDWRFHYLNESEFKNVKNKSPLGLAGCELPKIYNWIDYVHKNYPKRGT